MRLTFSGAPEVAAPLDHVWRKVLDPRAVAAAGPGVESVRVLTPERFRVITGFGLGGLRFRFGLDVRLFDIIHPTEVKLRASGHAPGSGLDVLAAIRLESLGAARTRLHWAAECGVSGMLGRIGARMMEPTARRLTGEFWDRFVESIGIVMPPLADRRTAQWTPARLASPAAASLAGALLLDDALLPQGVIPLGTMLDASQVAAISRAARQGTLAARLRFVWPAPGDIPGNDAAARLAGRFGPGLTVSPPAYSRVRIHAPQAGRFAVAREIVTRLNQHDLLDIQLVRSEGPVGAGALLAELGCPYHLMPAAELERMEQWAPATPPVLRLES